MEVGTKTYGTHCTHSSPKFTVMDSHRLVTSMNGAAVSFIPSFRIKDAQNVFTIMVTKLRNLPDRNHIYIFSFYLREAILIWVSFLIHVHIKNRDAVELNMGNPLSVFDLSESCGPLHF